MQYYKDMENNNTNEQTLRERLLDLQATYRTSAGPRRARTRIQILSMLEHIDAICQPQTFTDAEQKTRRDGSTYITDGTHEVTEEN